MNLINDSDKIYVAGSTGMVGNSICKILHKKGFTIENKKLITTTKKTLDLRHQEEVNAWFKKYKPDIVISAAAKVGGIVANNSQPTEFLLENLRIQNNLIEAAWKNKVRRFLFLGSSCIYPKFAKQPIKEEYLLDGPLEETNQCYAIAKIAGLKLCEALNNQYNFDAISLMPTNLYGPKDNYINEQSHVFAALLRKFHEAKLTNKKEVICWGTGKPLREFLYIEDFAEACFYSLNNWSPKEQSHISEINGKIINWLNVGSGYEISIHNLAHKISKIVGFKGKILWDKKKPDGTPRKKLNCNRINKLGWFAKTDIDQGIMKTYESFKHEMKNNLIRI